MSAEDTYQSAYKLFNNKALQYSERFLHFELYHDTFDILLQHIKAEDAAVLDAACGPGNISHYLLQKRPNLHITGIDIAPAMLQLAAQNCPNAHFQQLDCRNLDELKAGFDVVICGFGLPYLSKRDAEKFVADAAAHLSAGGLLYLSTMEGQYSESYWHENEAGERLFIHYHEHGYLQHYLEKNGFSILFETRKEYKGTLNSTDLVLIARLTK
ncbi:methyltransferase domain-containing protein [bacterium]|nr:methyltransferase domain-containing protein [bacterium]